MTSLSRKAIQEVSIVTLLSVVPYFACKLFIAGNTAYIEYFYGKIGPPTLFAEADTLHWEFLWMGTAMGGMRAVSILVGATVNAAVAKSQEDIALIQGSDANSAGRDDASDDEAVASTWTVSKVLRFLVRGRLPEIRPTDDSRLRVGDLANLAWLLTTLYGIGVTVIYYYSARTFFIAKHTSDEMRQQIQDYGRGFAPGVLPILWLYLNGQFALGVQAAGIPFIYDGVINNTVATVAAWKLYPHHGAYGLGLGMSIGAWVAWFLNALHFAIDPRWRELGISVPPFGSIIERVQRLPVMFSWSRKAPGVEYLWFAAPLAISNMCGLMQGLVTAALISERSTDDAAAYSISGAYYQTLSIAMLSISSSVSAVVSARAPVEDSSSPGITRRRRYFVVVFITVFILAAILALLPVIFPEHFANVFGAKVYSFGTAYTKLLMPRVKHYNAISCSAFMISTVGSIVSAALHGWRSLAFPTLIQGGGAAVGIIWAYALRHHDTNTIASGSILTAGIMTLFFTIQMAVQRKVYF